MILASKHIGVTTLTFQGHVTSSVTWPFDSQVPIFYRRSVLTKSLSPAVSEILSPKHIGVTNLTFQGHVMSSVTWPFDSQVPISYRRSIVTKSLSPALFETLASKYIEVTTLTFQGQVTSSVTWPLDSEWVISYWWSFGPTSLSLTVSEIIRTKHRLLIDTMLNRHCACAISRNMYPYVKFKYIFQFLTPTLPIHYATFIGLRWRIRGVLSVTSNVKGQIERK